MNEDKIVKIENCIDKICFGFKGTKYQPYYGELTLYHYTSFEKLFNILSGDSFWASRSRFSNDSTEDKILGEELIKKEQYYADNYIVCFCKEKDILSQWRGYCPQGGAAIGLKFPEGFATYSLLHSNYKEDFTKYGNSVELYKNRPFPVIYCEAENSNISKGVKVEDLLKLFNEPEIEETGCTLYDIAPYLKNGLFEEENELRLVFNNSGGEIEKCIRFRTLEDGSMIPYIVVKYGDILESGRCLSHTYCETKINEMFNSSLNSGDPIIIPNGRDQSDVCNSLFSKIRSYKKEIYRNNNREVERKSWEDNPIQIICEGHLPVVSITVSPSLQQSYMREVIERFCRSKYWLKNVEVNCSQIPYVAPKL